MMEKIDVFGISPRLYFQGKGLYQTKCGSVLTVLVVISIVFAFIFYGSEMFLKENPVTVFSEEFVRSPEKYEFKLKKNSMAIGLQNFNIPEIDVHFYDDSVYQFKFQFVKRSKFFNETTQKDQVKHEEFPIKSRKCTKDDFQVEGTQQAFHNLRFYPNLHCIDNYEAQDIEMQGDFGEDVFSYIEFRAFECRNSTENNVTCKSQEEIDRHLNSAFWAIYFSDQLVNPKNYTHPFQFIDRDIFGRSSNTQRKEYTMYYKNVYIESDTGILWSNKEIKRGVMLSYEKENTFNSIKKSGEFLDVQLRFQKFKQTRIFRSYINLGAVLAQVGGLSKVILMVFYVFSYFFVQRDYHIQVLNKLYNFKTHDEVQKEKTLMKSNTTSFMGLKQVSLDISKKDHIDHEYKQRLLDFFHKMFVNLKINSMQSFFSKCLGKNIKQEKELLDIAMQKLYRNLDVVRILTKLQEVDKLKELLLNNDQKQLFEYLPKPLIQESNNSLKHTKTDLDKQYEESNNEFNKIQGAFSAYKQIQVKESKTNLDRKIVDMLDGKVKKYFQNIYKPRESPISKDSQKQNDNKGNDNDKDSQKPKNNLVAPKEDQHVKKNPSFSTLNHIEDNLEDENLETACNHSTWSHIHKNNTHNNYIKPSSMKELYQFKSFNKLQKQELHIMHQQIHDLQEELLKLKQQKSQQITSSNNIQRDLLVLNSQLRTINDPFSSQNLQNNCNNNINNNNVQDFNNNQYNSNSIIRLNDSQRNLLRCQQNNNSFILNTPKGEDLNFTIQYDDINL